MSQKLANIRIFNSLNADEITKIINQSDLGSFEPGEYIFKEGDESDSFHITYSGTVEVFSTQNAGQDIELVKIGTGSTIGEVGFIDSKERVASVKAITPTTTLLFSRKTFDTIVESDSLLAMKILKEIGIILSERLRWCDSFLVSNNSIKIAPKFLDAIDSHS